jgi:hypothetical protein
MSELRRLLGPEAFDNLREVAGGTRIRIPKHYGRPPGGGWDSSRSLNRLVGESLALLLVFHFGGSVINVPKASNSTFDRAKLRRIVNRPLSANRIARLAGCDRRTVEKYRQRNSLGKERRNGE